MSAKIKLSKYDELLSQVQTEALKIKAHRESIVEFEHRAKDIVPRLFFALREEGLTAMDAKDRIEKDCVGVWKKGTIRDALPQDAKDQVKARAGRLGREKQLSEKKLREERALLEEEQRKKETIMPVISGTELMMSGTPINEFGPESYDERFIGKSDVFEDDNAQPSSPDESLYDQMESRQRQDGRLDKNLIKDITILTRENKLLKKENAELRKKNDDLKAVNAKLEHSVDTLIEDLKKSNAERDKYHEMYEKQKAK